MKKLKVITVVGTRPEIIRLACVMKRFDECPSIEQIIVHTGQNYDYELDEIFFKELGLRKPDYFLEAAGKNASETIGNIIIKIDPVLEKENPDSFLVLGDTNSCLCAIPAKKRKIPIFHMEAGNRCFDQRVPEETNRRIVDHISDINLTYSSIAREYLLREGLPADRVIKIGSPMYEVIHSVLPKVKSDEVLTKYGLKKNQYFLVSSHREENINSDIFFNLTATLNKIADNYKLPILVSTHPRTRNRINETGVQLDPLIQLMKPLGYIDYLALQMNAKVVISDSGTISEESSILKYPALNIREAHERPEAMEEASVMMVGLNTERILQAITALEDRSKNESLRIVKDYDVDNVSGKVLRIIISYTDYINRVVWNKK